MHEAQRRPGLAERGDLHVDQSNGESAIPYDVVREITLPATGAPRPGEPERPGLGDRSGERLGLARELPRGPEEGDQDVGGRHRRLLLADQRDPRGEIGDHEVRRWVDEHDALRGAYHQLVSDQERLGWHRSSLSENPITLPVAPARSGPVAPCSRLSSVEGAVGALGMTRGFLPMAVENVWISRIAIDPPFRTAHDACHQGESGGARSERTVRTGGSILHKAKPAEPW